MSSTAQAAPHGSIDEVAVTSLLRKWRLRGVVALAVWAIGLSLWAVFAPISGAVVGTGLVEVEANRQTVSHRDGGFVAGVLVREGETVAKGQPLIALEDARVDSAVDLLDAQLVAEQLRRSRLEAEAALSAQWQPPTLETATADPERASDALRRELSTFDARRQTLEGQLESVQAQLIDTVGEIEARQRNKEASEAALALLNDEIAANEALLEQNFVDRTRVLALRRGMSDYEARIESNEADLAQARQRKAELEGRLETLRFAYVQQAAEDLREANARIVDIEERLRAARDAAQRQIVVAPVAGRLVDLRVNTVGSAIGPLEPIVDIVPTDEALVVEARIPAASVTDVRAGQEADVRLLGHARYATRTLVGHVTHVSADVFEEPRSGAAYFSIQIELDPAGVEAAGFGPLRPGMAAEVFVRTSARTPLGFLLEPLVAGMRRSFREH